MSGSPKPRRAVRAAKQLRGVTQLGRAQQPGVPQRQVDRPCRSPDALGGVGEADGVQLAVDFGGHVEPGERGPPLTHLGQRHGGHVSQHLVDQVGRTQQRQVVTARQGRHPRLRLVAHERCGPPAPLGGHVPQAAIGLVRPGFQGGLLAQPDHIGAGRPPAPRGHELVDQDDGAFLDGGRALAELGYQRLADSGHVESGTLAGPARVFVPAPTQPGGEQVSQHPLVQFAEHDRRLVQLAGVQGAPLAIRHGQGPVEDHHVVVELGVAGAAVEMGERRRDDPFDVLLGDPARPRTGMEHLGLRIGQDDLDGFAVTVEDDLLRFRIGQRPRHRYPFGRTEREIKTGHRPALLWGGGFLVGLDHGDQLGPLFGGQVVGDLGYPGGDPLAQRGRRLGRGAAHRLAGDRVGQQAQHPEQMLLGDRLAPFEAEGGQAGAEEDAAWGAGGRVVGDQIARLADGAVTDGD